MRLAFLLAAGCAVLVSTALPALAHPSLQRREAPVGAPYRAIVSIPHGCDGSATIKLRVQIPEGVIGVKPMPKPGWAISTVRGPYARSYPSYHGQTLTEGIKEIAWSGRLADDFIDDFVFAGFLADTLPAGEMLFFPTYQECEKGEWRWIEVPGPGQDAHALAKPAPGVRLLPAADKTAARTYKVGPLVVRAPWTRATPGGAQVAGGFLEVTNTGAQPDRLIGGSLAPAATAEVHEMAMSDGIMKMRRLDKGLEIAPGQTVELKPGGYHMMFMGLREGLVAGRTVKGSLIFEKAGSVEVEFHVAPIGAQSGAGHKHH